MTRLAILVSAMLIGVGALALAAAQGSPSNSNQAVAITGSGDADALARRILYPRDLDDAANAVSEAFARAGMATVSIHGTMHQGVEPTIPFNLLDYEARVLADDARTRAEGGYRLTLADLAWSMSDIDWTVPDGRLADEFLRDVVAELILEARADADDPHSFVPLLLQSLAEHAAPPRDLTDATARPDQIELSLLEAQLLIAAHLRGDRSYDLPVGSGVGAPLLGAAGDGAQRLMRVDLLVSRTPCSDIEDHLGPFKYLHLVSLDQVTGALMQKVYTKLGLSDRSQKAIGPILSLLKALAATGNLEFSAEADPIEQHYSHAGEENEVTIITRADVKFDPYATELMALAMDCLQALGFPAMADLKGELHKAKVDWDLRGLKGHGTMSLAKNQIDFHSTLGTTLGRSHEARLRVDMRQERDPGSGGILKHDTAWVTATLDISEMPDPSILIKAMLPDGWLTVFDVLAEWSKKWTAPKRRAPFDVSWHASGTWTGTLRHTESGRRSESEYVAAQPPMTGGWSHSTVETVSLDATFRVDGAEEFANGSVMLYGIMTASGHLTHSGGLRGSGTDQCGMKQNEWNQTAMQRWNSSAHGAEAITVSIAIGKDGRYAITYTLPGLEGTTSYVAGGSNKGACNPFGDGHVHDSSEEARTMLWSSAVPSLSGTITGDTRQISGSWSGVGNNDGIPVTGVVIWNFTRTE
jgi:hypothetical protein